MSVSTVGAPVNSVNSRREGPSRRPRRAPRNGFLWILPALVVCVGLVYYCIGYTGYISTLNWDGVSPTRQSVGDRNYVTLLHDPVFWDAIRHTVIFFAATFIGTIVMGMLFAVLLHSNIRLAVLYKIIIFLPVILAPATMAPVFREMYAPGGQVNSVLSAIGLGSLTQAWLGQTSTALAVIIIIAIWQSTGVSFILYFAAMSQIDPEILEAARVDGAGNPRVIASIIWPSVRGTTIALAILGAIGALKTFDIPFLVSGGGPDYATEFLGTFIYRVSVPQSEVGYGAALSMMLLVLALAVGILFSLRGRERGSSDV